MKKQRKRSPLAEAELETIEESREWGRKRLKKKLQNMADKQGDISPLKPSEIDSYTETFDPFEDSVSS